jgi:hypothetical protein
MDHVERVALTEMGTVTGVRNAAIMASATVGSNDLSLLPSGLLRFLCALWLLALRLLGALRLRFLGLLLWLRFLGALLRLRFLGLLLWLRFLGALLRLRFLGVLLRLRLVLRRLGFFSASGLLLLAFLC